MSNENTKTSVELKEKEQKEEQSKEQAKEQNGFFDSLPENGASENAGENDENEKSLLSCLFSLTYLMESSFTTVDENKIIQSEPIKGFYFCSSDKLTIGYGTKIECKKNGKLCKEGKQTLKQLKIYKNGKELSEEKKQQLVHDCYNTRERYNCSHANKLCSLCPTAQLKVLYDNNPVLITKESALDTALTEYINKKEKLLQKSKNFNKNLILLALGTDMAYQYGDQGVTDTTLYKAVIRGTIPANANFSNYGDRTLLRQWMLETARLFEYDKKTSKGNPASSESQGKIFMKALKSFEKTFHNNIMNRQPHVKILMEKSLALVMTQNFQNIYGRFPRAKEIENIRQASQDFVYKELYGSPELKRVEKRYHENTIANAIKEADLNDPNPLVSIRKALKKAADISVAKSKKKAQKNNKKTKLTAILQSAEEKTQEIDSILFINQEHTAQGRA